MRLRIQGLRTSLINVLSSHLSTSAPSSPSALKQASRAIKTADASWSKPADIWWMLVDASAQLKIHIKPTFIAHESNWDNFLKFRFFFKDYCKLHEMDLFNFNS